MNTNYTGAYIFTKHTDLLTWFDTKYHQQLAAGYPTESYGFNQLRQSYAKARTVELILLYRFEGARTFCRIRCPINPLPIKGEFEVPSLAVVSKYLQANGWSFERKLLLSLLS